MLLGLPGLLTSVTRVARVTSAAAEAEAVVSRGAAARAAAASVVVGQHKAPSVLTESCLIHPPCVCVCVCVMAGVRRQSGQQWDSWGRHGSGPLLQR